MIKTCLNCPNSFECFGNGRNRKYCNDCKIKIHNQQKLESYRKNASQKWWVDERKKNYQLKVFYKKLGSSIVKNPYLGMVVLAR